MIRPAVNFLPARLIVRTVWKGIEKAPAATLLAVFFLLVSLACVTPLPRPDQTVDSTPSQAATSTPTPTSTPALAPTAVVTPTATPQATAIPTVEPTPPPESIDPTYTPVPTSAPDPTEDPGGLMLQVYAPEDGATVPGSAVAVYGQTAPGATVFISGDEAEVDAEGGFRADVSLAPAENEVTVTAVGEDGQRRSVTRTVTSLALPFLLLVTQPCNECIVSSSSLPISGRTGPNAIVSINGRSVPVDRFGYFSGTVLLEEGPNVIDVVATNDDGQTLSTVLAVIYRAPSE